MAGSTHVTTQGGAHLHTWPLSNADGTGESISNAGAADRTVHMFGTWGSATVILEGTNDPDQGAGNWVTLHDLTGAELTATADFIAMLAENTLFIRPVLSGGAGSTITVALLSRKSR